MSLHASLLPLNSLYQVLFIFEHWFSIVFADKSDMQTFALSCDASNGIISLHVLVCLPIFFNISFGNSVKRFGYRSGLIHHYSGKKVMVNKK